jgi:hypothetical protein
MLTKLLAAILLASCFALSVSPAEAAADALISSGSASNGVSIAFVDLHGPDFDVVGFLYETSDFAYICTSSYPCAPGGIWPGGFWNTFQYPFTNFGGTLTWQGITNQLARVPVVAAVTSLPSALRLPSESGTWHVDLPTTLRFSLPDLGFSVAGTGIRPVYISCDVDTNTCWGAGGTVEVKPVLACDGFASPANVAISLTSKSNRVIPLHMTLQDWWSHAPTTDANIPSGVPPVVEISFSPGPGARDVDQTDQFVLVATATDGNAFTYDSATNEWQLNLSTKPYTAAGTYIVRVRPGSSDYAIVRNDFDPTCETQFVRK